MTGSIPERKRKELGPTDGQYKGENRFKTSPSPKRLRHPRLQDNELCGRCAKIDLDEVLSREHLTVRGQLVRSLGPVKKWAIDSCSLCDLLATSLPPECRSPDSTYSLRSFSSKRDPRLGSDLLINKQPFACFHRLFVCTKQTNNLEGSK